MADIAEKLEELAKYETLVEAIQLEHEKQMKELKEEINALQAQLAAGFVAYEKLKERTFPEGLSEMRQEHLARMAAGMLQSDLKLREMRERREAEQRAKAAPKVPAVPQEQPPAGLPRAAKAAAPLAPPPGTPAGVQPKKSKSH